MSRTNLEDTVTELEQAYKAKEKAALSSGEHW
jgi:hypothetical protein